MNELNKILFLDIETVSQFATFDDCPAPVKRLWERKSVSIARNGESPTELYPKAGIYAEFGRIICISVGYFGNVDGEESFFIRSFNDSDEHRLLSRFTDFLSKDFNAIDTLLCAHNGKEFDFPYICRRCIVQDIAIPGVLNISGKKPWEIRHLDTLDFWKFGDYKHYTSLELLAHILGVRNPKEEMDGSQVYRAYWQDQDIQSITSYCERDVEVLLQVWLRLNNKPLLKQSSIVVAQDSLMSM